MKENLAEMRASASFVSETATCASFPIETDYIVWKTKSEHGSTSEKSERSSTTREMAEPSVLFVVGSSGCQFPEAVEEMESLASSVEVIESVSWKDILFISLSLIFYVVDLVLDGKLARSYFEEGYFLYFALTLAFVIIPAIIITLGSIVLYCAKEDRPEFRLSDVFTFIPLVAPFKRQSDALWFAVKSLTSSNAEVKVTYCKGMIGENADAAVLKMFENFMELGLQAVLQLFIILYYNAKEEGPLSNAGQSKIGLATASVMVSCIMLALSVTSYNVSCRRNEPEHGTISGWGMAFHYTWQLGTLSSRIICLAIFFALCPSLAFAFVFFHFVTMFLWLFICQRNTNDETKWWMELLTYLTFAYVHIFSRINVISNKQTRNLNWIFYLLVFVENSGILTYWIFCAPPGYYWRRYIQMIGIQSLFLIGISSMLLYYTYFHPSLLRPKQNFSTLTTFE